MAAEDDEVTPPKNLMEQLLNSVRDRYVEEHGEEPPVEFMQRARNDIVHNLASHDREENRDIYDALADE